MDDIVRWVGRIGVWTTFLAAMALSGVLIGNLLIHVFQVHPSLLLIALVDLGPLLGIFFGNISTGVTYYGTFRVLRGLDQYSLKDDAKSRLQSLPGILNSLFRFGPAISASLLIGSLVLSVLTLAPAHVLGVDPQAGSHQPSSPPGQTTHLPPTTQTPGPTPHLQFTLGNAALTQQCRSSSAVLPAFMVTLDNSASNVDATWSLVQIDSFGGTNQPWASASSTAGIVPAGHVDTLTLTPNPRLCSLTSVRQSIYHAKVQTDGAGAATISDQVERPVANVPKQPGTPPTASPPSGPPPAPVAKLAAHPATSTQTCDGSIKPYTVMLDTSGSTVPVAWTLAASDTTPGGQVWATASPTSDTISPGATETVTITPDPGVCVGGGGTTTTYHATIAPSGANRFAALALTDAITVQAHAAPSADPLRETQTCDDGKVQPYAVTLDNSASNVAITWAFVTDTSLWAAATPSSGTLAAGATTRLTITPERSVCALGGATVYQAQIAPTAGSSFAALTLTDTITAPVVFAPTIDGETHHSQSCAGLSEAYAVTLDNMGSNVPVTWSFSAQELGRDGKPWASSSPTGGTIPAGARQTIQIIPDPNGADCAPDDQTTFHATITLRGAGQTKSITLTDTITRPDH